MNNTKYLDWVDDLLPAQFHRERTAAEFVICYLSEALEQQQIQLDWNLSESGCLQVDAHREKTGVSQGKERIFTVQVQYE
jgi:acyl-ACP thioesterase